MKIIAPLDNPKEIIPMVNAGADEFYVGLEHDGLIFGSRKYKQCVLHGLNELYSASRLANSLGKKIFLVFNSPRLNSNKELPLIKDLVLKIKLSKIAGLIIANPELIRELKGLFSECFTLTVSSLTGTANTEAVALWKSFGAKRIVLDRQIDKHDVLIIRRDHPELELEVFAMYGSCKGLEFLCDFNLGIKDGFLKRKNSFGKNSLAYPHLCFTVFNNSPSLKGKVIDQKIKNNLFCRSFVQPENSCGLCSLPFFYRSGINSVKIVGRGSPLAHKLRSVELLKKSLALLELNKKITIPQYRSKNKALFELYFNKKCRPDFCYYPHLN